MKTHPLSLRAKRSNLASPAPLSFCGNAQHRASGLAGNLREGAAVDVLAALQESDRVGLADREIRAHQNAVRADPLDQVVERHRVVDAGVVVEPLQVPARLMLD